MNQSDPLKALFVLLCNNIVLSIGEDEKDIGKVMALAPNPHCSSQWGRGKAASITFPISFTTECYIVNGNSQNYVDYTDHRNAYLYSKIQTLSASQFGPYWGASVEFWWFAAGY